MVKRTTTPAVSQSTLNLDTIRDAADDIECAIGTANGLLRLALNELQSVTDTHADSAIRGAKRFINDIKDIAHRLHTCGAVGAPTTSAGVDRRGWTLVMVGAKPDSNRDVLVWDSAEQQPTAAFFDGDENCWFSKYDGHRLDGGAVTHWREIQAPEGVPA